MKKKIATKRKVTTVTARTHNRTKKELENAKKEVEELKKKMTSLQGECAKMEENLLEEIDSLQDHDANLLRINHDLKEGLATQKAIADGHYREMEDLEKTVLLLRKAHAHLATAHQIAVAEIGIDVEP